MVSTCLCYFQLLLHQSLIDMQQPGGVTSRSGVKSIIVEGKPWDGVQPHPRLCFYFEGVQAEAPVMSNVFAGMFSNKPGHPTAERLASTWKKIFCAECSQKLFLSGVLLSNPPQTKQARSEMTSLRAAERKTRLSEQLTGGTASNLKETGPKRAGESAWATCVRACRTSCLLSRLLNLCISGDCSTHTSTPINFKSHISQMLHWSVVSCRTFFLSGCRKCTKTYTLYFPSLWGLSFQLQCTAPIPLRPQLENAEICVQTWVCIIVDSFRQTEKWCTAFLYLISFHVGIFFMVHVVLGHSWGLVGFLPVVIL